MVSKSFLLLFTLIVYVKGNCNIIDEKYKENWEKGDLWINITDSETNYREEIESENIKSVTLDHKYIEASIIDDKLIFKAKEEFKNYIKNEDKTKYDFKIPHFQCENGATEDSKYLTLNVTETNIYEPTFGKAEYKFELPMPIAPNQIVEETAMIVTDYNINEKLTFTFIEGDTECTRYFDFDTKRTSKIYTTKLKTKDHVNLEKNIICYIQVEDKHGKKDKSQIVIEVDVQNSKVPNPMFKEPLIIVDYVEKLTVQLELLSQTYTPKPTITDDTGFAKYFDFKVVANNKIEIKLNEAIPEEELGGKNYFVLFVEVEYEKADNTGKSAVLVDLNKNTATTTTSTSTSTATTTPECTTTTIATTPCDCSTTSPGNTTTSTISTTTETDTSSCPSCPDCTTTINPGNTSTCPSNPECPDTSSSPGEGTTCPSCPETTTFPGEGTTCQPCPEITSPGESTTCPICPETTLPGESTTCPSNPECPSTSSDLTTSSLGSSTTPSNCDCSTSSPTTCPPLEPDPEVRFEKTSAFINRGKGETGLVDTFKAVSDINNEKITYNIKSVEPSGGKNKLKITEMGELYIKEELNVATYHILLTAFGKQSKSQDEIMVFLQIEEKILDCSDNTFQVERLINTKVKEGEGKKILNAHGARLDFTSDNDDILDWFKFNEQNDLQVLPIDREDERIKFLLAPQIQLKISVSSQNTSPQLRYNFSSNSLSQYAARDYSQFEYSCLNIKDIDMKADTMIILVSVEDDNDNFPIFVESNPLVVGYPEPKLVDFIAPPYLIKVTATDEDFGDNAKIKYTTNDKNFIADPENGIIFLGDEIKDNAEFKVIAEDKNGNGGNKAELTIKVKLLKEEHISVITIENIAYSEIENKTKEISSLTNRTVKYLSSIALPKVTEKEEEEEKKMLKVYSNDEKVPAVRIILYALDSENEIILAKDFKKIADDTDLGIEIKVEEYIAAPPNENQEEEEDKTGWIAAVSTLSVLLALVIIGGLLGYIFYLRPRIMESPSDGYKKHTNRDSIQISSIETKIESATTLSDRRPTGFPSGFNPKDLDDEEDEDYDNVFEKIEEQAETKMEIDVKEDEVINDSEISSDTESEQKPKPKVGVKFDANVTEIEIEEF